MSGERVLSRVVLIRQKKPRRERGQVRRRHRTAADKRDETHHSLQAPVDLEVGRIGNLVWSRTAVDDERPRDPICSELGGDEGVFDSCVD